jgi:hypothetical protein
LPLLPSPPLPPPPPLLLLLLADVHHWQMFRGPQQLHTLLLLSW